MPLEEADEAIRAGQVRVGTQIIREPLAEVRLTDTIVIGGRKVSLQTQTRALAFHKPAGSVTAPSDKEARPTVFELLRRQLPKELVRYGWHAIGRLDLNTTGLLLFTNDEGLVGHVTAPESQLKKRYLAKVQGLPTPQRLGLLVKGIKLDDGEAIAASAELKAPGEVVLVLTEGRFHQAKRMLGAIGFPVTTLHREAIGGIELDVPLGAWRALTDDELAVGLGYPPKRFFSGSV